MSHFRVIFTGQPTPDSDRDTAIANFARLLKRTPEQATAAFNGKALVLKKGISKEDADKLVAVLLKSGLQARAEAEPSSLELSPELEAMSHEKPAVPAPKGPIPRAGVAPKVPADLTLVREEELDRPKEEAAARAAGIKQVAAGRMVCPACNHEQGHADICEKCGIVIAKFKARQAAKAAAESQAPAKNIYAPGDAEPEAATEHIGDTHLPELFAMNVEGRIGRVRYLAWSLAPALPALFAGVVLALTKLNMLGILVAVPLFLAAMVLGIRVGVLRLHDRNHSGWLLLLMLVPLINIIFAFYLLLAPGTQGDNDYGPPPSPNSTAVIIVAVLYCLLMIGNIATQILLAPTQHAATSDAEQQANFEAAMQRAMEDPEFQEAMEDPEFRQSMENLAPKDESTAVQE